MYNLDVAVADTFYVGDRQWLVHNGCPPFEKYFGLKNEFGILASVDDDGVLSLIVRADKERVFSPTGRQMFNLAWDELGSQVKVIQGYWRPGGELSDNYTSYWKAIAQGKTPQDAALNYTWMAIMAKEKGFTKVLEISHLENGALQVRFGK